MADSVKKTPTMNNGIFTRLSLAFFCLGENNALVRLPFAKRFDPLQAKIFVEHRYVANIVTG